MYKSKSKNKIMKKPKKIKLPRLRHTLLSSNKLPLCYPCMGAVVWGLSGCFIGLPVNSGKMIAGCPVSSVYLGMAGAIFGLTYGCVCCFMAEQRIINNSTTPLLTR